MSTSQTSQESKPGQGDDHKSISLVVSAPNTPDSKHMSFKLASLVGEDADEAAEKFGYAPGWCGVVPLQGHGPRPGRHAGPGRSAEQGRGRPGLGRWRRVSSPPAFTRATVEVETSAIDAWCRRKGWTWRMHLDELQLPRGPVPPEHRSAHRGARRARGVPGAPAHLAVRRARDRRIIEVCVACARRSVRGERLDLPHEPVPLRAVEPARDGDHGGPHGEWTMTSWRQAAGDYTKADTLADMLDQIHQHLGASPGMQE